MRASVHYLPYTCTAGSVRSLFRNKGSLSSRLRATEQAALEGVKDIAPDIVLATPEADLVD